MAIGSASIKINGVSYALTYNGTSGKWEATVTAPGLTSYNQSGHYYACEVTATNLAGTATTVGTDDGTVGNSLKLVVKETIKPVITITSPSAGAYVTNNRQPVVATLIDESGGSGIDPSTVVVKLDGTAVAASAIATTGVTGGYSMTFTPAAALSDGSHTVSVDVKDNDGNSALTKTTTFTVDTVAPTLNISAPAAGSYSASGTVAYSGTTNDATSSPVTVTVKLDNAAQSSPVVAANGSFSGTFTGLTTGQHTAVFTATDSAGKSTSVSRVFNVDTTSPVISSVSITPNPADTGATMVISVTVA